MYKLEPTSQLDSKVFPFLHGSELIVCSRASKRIQAVVRSWLERPAWEIVFGHAALFCNRTVARLVDEYASVITTASSYPLYRRAYVCLEESFSVEHLRYALGVELQDLIRFPMIDGLHLAKHSPIGTNRSRLVPGDLVADNKAYAIMKRVSSTDRNWTIAFSTCKKKGKRIVSFMVVEVFRLGGTKNSGFAWERQIEKREKGKIQSVENMGRFWTTDAWHGAQLMFDCETLSHDKEEKIAPYELPTAKEPAAKVLPPAKSPF